MSENISLVEGTDSSSISWEGKQAFYIARIGREDDTLRIKVEQCNTKEPLILILPTLCITYADMKFANEINGVQKDYPDSAIYGPKFFDPPVVLNGRKRIEEFTWIRGAVQVKIGPKRTFIKWECWNTLVIPRLRIKKIERVKGVINTPQMPITKSRPFLAKIMQYADGRHIGGVQVTKRHPDWKPDAIPEKFDLWIRVIDSSSRSAIQKANVNLFIWQEIETDTGKFIHKGSWYTDEMGIINLSDLACSEKVLLIIEHKQFLSQTWRFRPLPSQTVKKTFKLWKSEGASYPYKFQDVNSLETIAKLTNLGLEAILNKNDLTNINQLEPSLTIEIPCFKAVYHAEKRDTIDYIAKRFCYNSVEELVTANQISKPYRIYPHQLLHLPGWFLFKIESNVLFENLDKRFNIPTGWIRPLLRTLHDDPSLSYEREIVAIPTRDFIQAHKLRSWFDDNSLKK